MSVPGHQKCSLHLLSSWIKCMPLVCGDLPIGMKGTYFWSWLIQQWEVSVKLMIHFHLVPKLRMSGAILSLPNNCLWCAQGHLHLRAYVSILPSSGTASHIKGGCCITFISGVHKSQVTAFRTVVPNIVSLITAVFFSHTEICISSFTVESPQ
jgi:hypothetical protein